MTCPSCRARGEEIPVETEVELHEAMLNFLRATCTKCDWSSRYGPI